MELDEAADELYGLRPQEFTAARDDRARRARAEGRRELAEGIRGLRRPTRAAWASNLLVRERGEEVAPLLRLGEELRGAHRTLDGEELRTLSHRQHQLVEALAGQAEQLAAEAGTPIGAQARQEVAQTLHAVLADPDAAREWAAGRLSRPLTAVPGFEAAAREAAAAPARRGGGARQRPGERTKQAQAARREERTARPERGGKPERAGQAGRAARTDGGAKAARAVREAADRARLRRQEANAAAEETAAARAAREEDEERVGRLRAELREAEDAHKRSRQDERRAERTERETRRRAEAAEEAESRARHKAEAASGDR